MPSSQKELLCTLGPSSFEPAVIRRLTEHGATLFRINLSHTAVDEFAQAVELIQAATHIPICVDTEGAQIRTGRMSDDQIRFSANNDVWAVREPITGDATRFNFNPPNIIDALKLGDIISIDFNSALVQVAEEDETGLRLRVLSGGVVGQNKAVTVQRQIYLPPLTAKDIAVIDIAKSYGIRESLPLATVSPSARTGHQCIR